MGGEKILWQVAGSCGFMDERYINSLDIINKNDLVAELCLNLSMKDISSYIVEIFFGSIKGHSRINGVCVVNSFSIGHLILNSKED